MTGTVACMWIADWNRARATGDTGLSGGLPFTDADSGLGCGSEWGVSLGAESP